MSLLCIEEYQETIKEGRNVEIDVPASLLRNQNITSFSSSVSSEALFGSTKYVILTSDVDCYFVEAESPTADSDDRYLPAFTPRPFSVTGGNKIAVIAK